MSDPIESFNCHNWYAEVSAKIGVEPKICGFRKGSTIVEMELDEPTVNTLLTDPDALGIPRMISVTDPLSGQTVTTGGGALHIGAIVGIAVGILALIGIIVLVA